MHISLERLRSALFVSSLARVGDGNSDLTVRGNYTGLGEDYVEYIGRDILIQAEDPMEAASFYVKELGFEITSKTLDMVSLHGTNINLFIERGPTLGPVLEVTVESVQKAKENLKKTGCEIIKDEPEFSRCYVKDPNRLIYNLTE